MHLLQVVVPGGVLTPIIPKAVVPANSAAFSVLVAQNNGGSNVRIGDSQTSATKGILLLTNAGGGGGSQTITPALQYSGDLTEFFLFSAGGTTVDIMIFD